MIRAMACAFVVLAAAAAPLGVLTMLSPGVSAVEAVLLVAPLALIVVALSYVKPDGGSVDFYWTRMFAHPGAPRWRRTLYRIALGLGAARRYGGRR